MECTKHEWVSEWMNEWSQVMMSWNLDGWMDGWIGPSPTLAGCSSHGLDSSRPLSFRPFNLYFVFAPPMGTPPIWNRVFRLHFLLLFWWSNLAKCQVRLTHPSHGERVLGPLIHLIFVWKVQATHSYTMYTKPRDLESHTTSSWTAFTAYNFLRIVARGRIRVSPVVCTSWAFRELVGWAAKCHSMIHELCTSLSFLPSFFLSFFLSF
jgi:hypothetical protein